MKILIATPCGEKIGRNFIECREDAVAHLHALGYRVETKLYEGPCISINRNIAFIDAFNKNVNCLVFIDSDMEFDASDIIKIVEHPGEVVTGVCKTGSGTYALYSYAAAVNQIVSVDRVPSVIELCGGAFLGIKRSVIAEMNEVSFRNREWRKVRVRDQTMDYPFNHITFPSHIQAGEDISFCFRLMEMGITIHVANDALIGHEKLTCIR